MRLPIVLLLAATLLTSVAAAQAPTDSQRREARERFDRALKLFNSGDDGGALAEFERAYAIVPHPLVLFNIAGVHAAMGRAVKATDAYDKLLAAPGSLKASKLAEAKARRGEQAARVARLEIKTNVPGASIEIDGVERAKSPSKPIRVTSGTHRVAVIAPGHSPVRKDVTIAGGRTESVQLTLQPLEGRLGSIEIQTDVPDLEVFVDGASVGRTPLLGPVPVAPGQRQIELRRAGYRTEKQTVQVADGANLNLKFSPNLDPAVPARGALALSMAESEAVVFINDVPRGPYAAAYVLPAGKHKLRVERSGFFPVEREVLVPAIGVETVKVELEPTPDFRADYRESALDRRLVGWLVLGSGAVVVGASAGFLIWNQGRLNDAQAIIDESGALLDEGARCEPGVPTTMEDQKFCMDAGIRSQAALDNKDTANARSIVGWTVLGVGAVGAGIGTVLLLTNDDPGRYEPRPESDVFGGLRPGVAVGRGQLSLGVSGHF